VLTLVLSWYFPHHVWDGEFATDYGNYYTNFWGSAEEVALGAARNKTASLQHALEYHRTFLETVRGINRRSLSAFRRAEASARIH
jgi:uncharacterized protein (DUF608 family)